MFRLFLAFLVLTNIVCFAQKPFIEYKTQLLSVNGDIGQVPNSSKIVKGSSGVVIHRFDNKTATIIARVVVQDVKGANAILKFEVFDLLEQASFPLPGITPVKGDEVILNYLYDRALIVAPNETIFKEVTSFYNDISWIHPDIMAAYLSANYKPNPKRHDFDAICRKHSTGLIFFALDLRGFFADCQSLKVLKVIKSGKIANYQLPFYNRTGDIDTAFWKWDGASINNYNAHYARLLGL